MKFLLLLAATLSLSSSAFADGEKLILSGAEAHDIRNKFGDAGCDVDASNGGSRIYAVVVCSHASAAGGGTGTDEDYTCSMKCSDRSEYNK